MSYYRLDGVSGVFASPDVQTHEQTKTWRWIVASFLLLLSLGLSGVAVKVFASVEQTHTELPQVVTSTPLQPTPSLRQAPAPAVLPETNTTSDLQKELELWAETKSSTWAFYVQSLDGGEIKAQVNDAQQFQMASIYKLFLLKPLAKKLPAEAWASNHITERTYLACVQAMLSVSDNPCAEAIAGNLGWNNIHKQTQSDGYKNTTLNDTERFNTTTSDVGLLLDRLYHGDGYDAKTKGIVLEALAKRKSVEAIRVACADCKVYNKTGDLDGYKHDAAIVEKNGKSYVVVIFSSGASWLQLREAAGIITSQL